VRAQVEKLQAEQAKLDAARELFGAEKATIIESGEKAAAAARKSADADASRRRKAAEELFARVEADVLKQREQMAREESHHRAQLARLAQDHMRREKVHTAALHKMELEARQRTSAMEEARWSDEARPTMYYTHRRARAHVNHLPGTVRRLLCLPYALSFAVA